MITFAVFVFLASLATLWQIFRGMSRMRTLAEVRPDVCSSSPLVSIIVPACNEEKTVEPALRSLLQQDYPNVEIIVVDDRSTDSTFTVLMSLQEEYPDLLLEQITQLPVDWLGKNHALYRGARKANGEILLFTDADVVMEPSTLSRSVTWLQSEQLDHLSLVFRNIAQGGLLNAMIVDALGGLFLLLRPWDVRKGQSRAFAGIGAFNMIRKEAYWQVGGHASFQMHPIDDIMLGKKVKRAGLAQDCLLGTSFVRVRWYETLPAMVNGLMKNIFALYGYSLSFVVLGLMGIVVMSIVPLLGLLFSQGPARFFFAAALLCRFAVFSCNARGMQVRSNLFLWSLLTPYLTVFIVIKAVYMTLKNQGIEWRGTHYPLQELKKEERLLDIFPDS